MKTRITAIHQWFCEATGQKLAMAFDRERLWFEIFNAGFEESDVRRVVWYLRKEIAAKKRNPGALKLSNMLKPENFEEDLNLSRVSFDPEQKLPPLPGVSYVCPKCKKPHHLPDRFCSCGCCRVTSAPAIPRNPDAGRKAFEEFTALKKKIYP